MRTLVIGDIHGCHRALTTLLGEVRPQLEDRVVFLGDYIDGGSDSRSVVECLIRQREFCSPVFLRGNHEAMILEAREDTLKANLWQSYGGFETMTSYGAPYRQDWAAAIPKSHWTFLEQTIRHFETAKHIFVHASLDPELDLNEQPDWLLYWEHFDTIRPHKSGKKIICGHSPQRSGKINDLGFAACIDTGPAKGGWLTCVEVESGRYWQANERGERRDGSLDRRVSS